MEPVNRRRRVRPPNGPKRRRTFLIGSFAAWTAAALALGTAGGYELFNRYATHAAPDIVVQPHGPDSTGTQATSVAMPDVEGLTRQSALEALADAGLDPGTVAFEDRPYAAAAGSVVGQSPVRGTRNPESVKLALAVPASVPQLAGQHYGAGVSALEALGARARVVQIYNREIPVDRVISTEPSAGTAIAEEVVVRVSAAPSAIFLSNLNASNSSCRNGLAKVAGKDLKQSVICTVPTGTSARPVTADYTLSGNADGLVATLGVAVDSPPGSSVSIKLLGDGQSLRTVEVSSAETKSLEVEVSGVVRLQIEVTGTGGARAVLGDAQLIGSPAGINALQARR